MPTASANSPVPKPLSMADNSHHANYSSSEKMHSPCNAPNSQIVHNGDMGRKRAKNNTEMANGGDWYLAEWMDALKVRQSDLARLCDFNVSTMHGIYHGRTAYYRDLVNLIASKLNLHPFELLMPPEKAMAMRRMQDDALRIVSNAEILRNGTQ